MSRQQQQQLESVVQPALQKLDVNAPVIDVVEEFQFGEYPYYVNACCSNATSNRSDDYMFGLRHYETGAFDETNRILTLYGIPIIIIIGCLGNTLSFVVFVCSHLSLQPSSVYLAFLNVVDTLFLLCLLVTWLDHVDVHLLGRHGVCQLVIYFSYVSGFLSVYTVAAFTVERWILVFCPQHKNTWCTRRRALLVLSILTVTSLPLYTFYFWTMGPVTVPYMNKSYCLPKPQFYTFLQVFSTVDTLITLIIPSLIIITLNVSISRKVMQYARAENEQLKNNNSSQLLEKRSNNLREMGSICYVRKPTSTQQGCTGGASGGVSTCSPTTPNTNTTTTTFNFKNLTLSKSGRPRSFRKRVQLRTTRSLLIVSSVFVLLNLPSHAFRTYAVVMEFANADYTFSNVALLWQKLLQLVYYANFAANFCLYSACSRSFRLAVRRLCARVRHNAKAKWNRLRTNSTAQKPTTLHRKRQGSTKNIKRTLAVTNGLS